MNRKDDEISRQLGDPLPLPYRIGGEETRKGGHIARELINSDVLYHKNVPGPEIKTEPIMGTRELGTMELAPREQAPNWHRSSSQELVAPDLIKLNRLRPNPIRREFIRRLRDIDLINTIENKLEYVKLLIENNRLSPDQLSFLQDIQYQLDLQLTNTNSLYYPESEEDLNEDSYSATSPIMDELEKLQNQSTEIKQPVLLPDKKVIIILLLCTIIYLSSSYYVSELRYEYCYYYC